jgi:hypothetical protein
LNTLVGWREYVNMSVEFYDNSTIFQLSYGAARGSRLSTTPSSQISITLDTTDDNQRSQYDTVTTLKRHNLHIISSLYRTSLLLYYHGIRRTTSSVDQYESLSLLDWGELPVLHHNANRSCCPQQSKGVFHQKRSFAAGQSPHDAHVGGPDCRQQPFATH